MPQVYSEDGEVVMAPGRPRAVSISIEEANVLLDALNEVADQAIRDNVASYDQGEPSDPLASEAGYRAVMGSARTKLAAIVEEG